MHRLCDVIAETGAKALGAIMYGISPVHTDEWFAQRVRQMASWPSVSAIYVEDAPGILTPERARTLIPAILAAAGDKPVEWHFHNNTAMGALNYMIAVELGGTILHTCSRPLANGPVAAVDRADRGQPRPARPRPRHRRERAAARRRRTASGSRGRRAGPSASPPSSTRSPTSTTCPAG